MSSPYRYTMPVHKKTTTGQVGAVYAQMQSDFILTDGPLMSLSPAPEILTATWALLRESQLVGSAPRSVKEAVATCVSVANRCPFCVDAHTALVHATGDHDLAELVRQGKTPSDPYHAEVIAWAQASRTPEAPELISPPFPAEHRGQYMGTVLVTHFINRMVSGLLDEALLPANLGSSKLVRRAAGAVMGRSVRRQATPGESLALLPDLPPSSGPDLADERVGTAFHALKCAAGSGAELLTLEAAEVVKAVVGEWNGEHPPMVGTWLNAPLEALRPEDRPGAKLAILGALASYRITDEDVAAWRGTDHEDADLIRVLAFGAITAVERIEGWITATPREGKEAAAAQ